MRLLEEGVDVVTGTPGRLDEFISSGDLDLSRVRFLILDEADGLLSQGHDKFINRIHAAIPKIAPDGSRLQMVVCSATLHNFDVKKMAVSLLACATSFTFARSSGTGSSKKESKKESGMHDKAAKTARLRWGR